jgi:hypothetical protein
VRLPGGGPEWGALHEVAGRGASVIDGASAPILVTRIAARTRGKVLWGITRPGHVAPALSQAALKSDRAIQFEAGGERALHACFEEGLYAMAASAPR